MRIQLPNHNCYLVRRVLCDGVEYGLSTVSVKEGEIVIRDFEKETPSTIFVDGAIVVEPGISGPELIQVL